MTKYCFISTRSENAMNILNGNATVLLRKVVLKWVLEEVAKGNTVKFLMYVTKAKPFIEWVVFEDGSKSYYEEIRNITEWNVNGRIAASFDVSKIEDVKLELIDKSGYDEDKQVWFETHSLRGNELEVMSYVSQDEMEKYFTNEVGYALHISNLNVFDKPKELSDYYYFKTKWVYSGLDCPPYVDEVKTTLTKAPQNMMTVWGE